MKNVSSSQEKGEDCLPFTEGDKDGSDALCIAKDLYTMRQVEVDGQFTHFARSLPRCL